VEKVLSPLAFGKQKVAKVYPDYGLYMLKLGWSIDIRHHFLPIAIPYIAKINDDLYSIAVNADFGNNVHCISFDFTYSKYLELLEVLDIDISQKVKNALKNRPFDIEFNENPPSVGISAVFSKVIHSNKLEDYCPLMVTEFMKL
jgi:hypothetical protein